MKHTEMLRVQQLLKREATRREVLTNELHAMRDRCIKLEVELRKLRDRASKDFDQMREFARLFGKEQDMRVAAEWNMVAYMGALGYPMPGGHNGKLIDGTTPICGICDARKASGK